MPQPKIKHVILSVPRSLIDGEDRLITIATSLNRMLSIADQVEVVLGDDQAFISGTTDAKAKFLDISDTMVD